MRMPDNVIWLLVGPQHSFDVVPRGGDGQYDGELHGRDYGEIKGLSIYYHQII